jgi:hypothetical protein
MMLALGAGCAPGPGGSEVQYAIQPKVTVSVFSGREEPEFELSDAAIVRLESLLAELDSAFADGSSSAGRLGFRGFVVHDSDGSEFIVAPDQIGRVSGGIEQTAQSAGEEYATIYDDVSDDFSSEIENIIPTPES